MKFSDIPVDTVEVRMLRAYRGKRLKSCSVLKIIQSPENPFSEYELYTEDDIIVAEPIDKREAAAKLDRELSSDPSYLARIIDIDLKGGFTLEVAFFAKAPLEIGEQDIGVDEYIVERMSAITGRDNTRVSNALCDSLFSEFCYQQGNDCFFFVLVGSAAEGELDTSTKDQRQQEEKLTDSQKGLAPNKTNSFCVLSNNISFIATEKPMAYGSSIYIATKMHERKAERDKAIRLAHGKLSFVDWSKAGRVQVLARYQLESIVQENSSYLKTWDDFGNIEGEILLRDARQFGIIYYRDAIENREGTATVSIAQATNTARSELAAGRIEGLEYLNEVPPYIEEPEMPFEEFASRIAQAKWKSSDYYKVLRYDESAQQITLDVEHLPTSGKLAMSLQGNITQIRRRNYARKAILESRSANPQLGLLLEEKGKISTQRLPKKAKALNAYVKDKVFRNDPTYKQEEAIAVALNTPDIALIQGPPGTGKTTVIAAIVERLNQESTRSGSEARGQVLLTGFQHDAVENMIDRISLNSIPVPKIGKKSGQVDDDITSFERSLNHWCENIVNAIKRKYPDLEKATQNRRIDQLIEQYIMVPTQGLAVTLTHLISEMPPKVLGEECISEAKRLSERLSVRTALYSIEGRKYLQAARLIRTSEAAFLDDGPDRAEDALDVLYDVLDPEERGILQNAADWPTSKGLPPFIDKIIALRRALMLRFTAPPTFREEKMNNDVLILLKKYQRIMQKRAAESFEDQRLAALAEFIADLQGNSSGIIDAISEYSFAFAATCQQSAGKKMQSLKGIGGADDSAGLEYDYVIVDEAARVSPRDLMVPMAQGKRIILVGDHRQLPHIIDEEVARQMELDGANVSETEWLKKSMFEYLFTERLKDLESQDGIVRRVTLDKQFRMHPVIGDFISRNFYERFDPKERIYSGLPASVFAHNLPGTRNKPVAWLEVPTSLGAHSKRGTSWIRQAEIDAIADQLFKWMNCEEGKSLTFGVISFYKAQADLIRKSLDKLGADESRLRVGTVDAFQGMEFDVVFLSMVRTLPKNFDSTARQQTNRPDVGEGDQRSKYVFGRIKRIFDSGGRGPQTADESSVPPQLNYQPANNPEEQKQAQKMFGHLCLYNRLNVAMSRQKKLLVVAGDSSLLGIGIAEKYIPGLVDFYDLCRREGVMIQCQQ